MAVTELAGHLLGGVTVYPVGGVVAADDDATFREVFCGDKEARGVVFYASLFFVEAILQQRHETLHDAAGLAQALYRLVGPAGVDVVEVENHRLHGAAEREAQFAVGRVYRMPFRERRVFDEQTGRPRYVPLEPEPVTTGVALVDAWLTWLGAGAEGGVEVFCRGAGVRREDWEGLVRVLSGVSCQEFMTLYALRLADDLLRFTRMRVAEVAARSGFGSERNVYRVFLSRYGMTPRERRLQLQQPGDAGRYRL